MSNHVLIRLSALQQSTHLSKNQIKLPNSPKGVVGFAKGCLNGSVR